MSQGLRNLLVLVAAFGSGILIYTVRPGTTMNQLVDAGIRSDCNLVDIACTFFVDASYEERILRGAACQNPDSGRPEVILPELSPEASRYIVSLEDCRRVQGGCTTCDGGTIERDAGLASFPKVTGSCACWQRDAGQCREIDDYGVAGPASRENTIRPGRWQGPGCRPIPCVERFGYPLKPKQCD